MHVCVDVEYPVWWMESGLRGWRLAALFSLSKTKVSLGCLYGACVVVGGGGGGGGQTLL